MITTFAIFQITLKEINMNKTQKIEINQANIEHNHFYLSSCINFFPIDAIGGSNKSENAGKEIRISLPVGEDVFTDIAGDKKIFRKRAWIGKLYKHSNAVAFDQITMTWIAPYHLKVEIIKNKTNNEYKEGQTIQIPINKAYWLERKKYEIPAEHLNFFPSDALGAREKTDMDFYPLRGVTVEFDYGNTKSICDVATRKSGAMRPRDNTGMRKFFDDNEAALGDVVSITKTGVRCYNVSLIKR